MKEASLGTNIGIPLLSSISETCCDSSTNLHTLAVAFICHTTDCKGLNMAYHLWCPELVGVWHAHFLLYSVLLYLSTLLQSMETPPLLLLGETCEKLWKGITNCQQPLPWRDCWSAAKSSSFFLIPAEPPQVKFRFSLRNTHWVQFQVLLDATAGRLLSHECGEMIPWCYWYLLVTGKSNRNTSPNFHRFSISAKPVSWITHFPASSGVSNPSYWIHWILPSGELT